MQNLEKHTNEPICKAEIETQMYGHQNGKGG